MATGMAGDDPRLTVGLGIASVVFVAALSQFVVPPPDSGLTALWAWVDWIQGSAVS